jgi:hypothetical protein
MSVQLSVEQAAFLQGPLSMNVGAVGRDGWPCVCRAQGAVVARDRRALTVLLRLAAPVLGRLPSAWMPGLAAALLPFARALRRLGTPRGVLLLRAHDRAGVERDRVELLARAAGLDIPAAPVVWVVARLVAGGFERSGLLGLEDVVTPEAAIAWLREAGYELREGGGGR